MTDIDQEYQQWRAELEEEAKCIENNMQLAMNNYMRVFNKEIQRLHQKAAKGFAAYEQHADLTDRQIINNTVTSAKNRITSIIALAKAKLKCALA